MQGNCECAAVCHYIPDSPQCDLHYRTQLKNVQTFGHNPSGVVHDFSSTRVNDKSRVWPGIKGVESHHRHTLALINYTFEKKKI